MKDRSYTWVIGLKKSNLETFILEVSFGLSEIHGCVIRGGMPRITCQSTFPLLNNQGQESHRPVGQKGDLVSGHLEYSSGRVSCFCQYTPPSAR